MECTTQYGFDCYILMHLLSLCVIYVKGNENIHLQGYQRSKSASWCSRCSKIGWFLNGQACDYRLVWSSVTFFMWHSWHYFVLLTIKYVLQPLIFQWREHCTRWPQRYLKIFIVLLPTSRRLLQKGHLQAELLDDPFIGNSSHYNKHGSIHSFAGIKVNVSLFFCMSNFVFVRQKWGIV